MESWELKGWLIVDLQPMAYNLKLKTSLKQIQKRTPLNNNIWKVLTLLSSHFSFSFSTSPPKTLVLLASSIRKLSWTVMEPVK